MVSPDNILFHLSEQDERRVRAIYDDLAALGFPRQNQTPHITITFAPQMPDQVVDRAAQLLPGLVPAEFHRAGTVVFGVKKKQTVAWLLEPAEELETVARQISALNPHGRGSRWIPHLTMGLRLQRDIVPDYIRALDQLTSPHLKTITAQRAGLWQPQHQTYTQLAGE